MYLPSVRFFFGGTRKSHVHISEMGKLMVLPMFGNCNKINSELKPISSNCCALN